MNYKKESGRRLQAARNAKKLTLTGLSKALGGVLSASRLGNYEQGARQLGIKESLAISKVLGVNAAYLLCVEPSDDEMTEQEHRLLRDFRALPEKDRNEYARRIGSMALVYREPVPDERLHSSGYAKKPAAAAQHKSKK